MLKDSTPKQGTGSVTQPSQIQPEHIRHERFIEATETRTVLDKRLVAHLKKSSTTPDVKNVEYWHAKNTGAISITKFLNGQEGQHLYILGDSQTTLVHGTGIDTIAGANLLMLTDKMYHFIYSGLTPTTRKWRQV